MIIHSDTLEHLHFHSHNFVHSINDCKDGRDLSQVTMTDIMNDVRVTRHDGQPVNKLAQDAINQFTFHFIRKDSSFHQWKLFQCNI